MDLEQVWEQRVWKRRAGERMQELEVIGAARFLMEKIP